MEILLRKERNRRWEKSLTCTKTFVLFLSALDFIDSLFFVAFVELLWDVFLISGRNLTKCYGKKNTLKNKQTTDTTDFHPDLLESWQNLLKCRLNARLFIHYKNIINHMLTTQWFISEKSFTIMMKVRKVKIASWNMIYLPIVHVTSFL